MESKFKKFFYVCYCRVVQFFIGIITLFNKFPIPTIIDNYDNLIKKINDYLENLTDSTKRSVAIFTSGSMIKLGYEEELRNKLEEAKFEVYTFDKIQQNPSIKNVEDGLSLCKATKTKVLIALGGGSVIDCAKAVCARISRPEKTVKEMKGLLKVKKMDALLIAIPSTAGTGSETSIAAVITDEEQKIKFSLNDPILIPKYAILNPKLTLTLPPNITAFTGMDALSHAVEVYISKSWFNKKIAKEAIISILNNLTTVFHNGDNVEARRAMLNASFLAGVAFTKAGVGNIHALSHQISAMYETPHGKTNAILMPYVLEYYGEKTLNKLNKINDNFLEKIINLNKEMNIPIFIEELKTEDIPILAKNAVKEANPLYPSPKVFMQKDMEIIYKKLIRQC